MRRLPLLAIWVRKCSAHQGEEQVLTTAPGDYSLCEVDFDGKASPLRPEMQLPFWKWMEEVRGAEFRQWQGPDALHSAAFDSGF